MIYIDTKPLVPVVYVRKCDIESDICYYRLSLFIIVNIVQSCVCVHIYLCLVWPVGVNVDYLMMGLSTSSMGTCEGVPSRDLVGSLSGR